MQYMEKNTYPKIKDKSNRWRRTPHQRFQEYFPPLPKARPNSEHGFTRIHVEHSSLGLPMKFPIVGGLFLVYARPSGTGCTHARTHTQGIRRKIVPLSRTDYQEFPGTINLLAATPQAPFPPLPPLLFFRQPHSPSLLPGKATRERPIQPIVRDGEPGCCTDQKPLSRPEAAAILLWKRG